MVSDLLFAAHDEASVARVPRNALVFLTGGRRSVIWCLYWGTDILLRVVFLQQNTHLLLCPHHRTDTFYLKVMASRWGTHLSLRAVFPPWTSVQSLFLPGEQTSFIQSGVTAVYQAGFNATTVAPAAGVVSIWLSESATDLQPFYWDCIKKAQAESWFYGRAFPRSPWPDGYYEDKSNFHAKTLIHSRGWSMTVCWRMG